MSKEKQIEEMAKALCPKVSTEYCASGNCTNPNCLVNAKALESLYNAGYRKQSEGEWVLEHETYGKMICSNCKEEAPTKTVVDRDCTRHILYDKKPFCPNCGAKMCEKTTEKGRE